MIIMMTIGISLCSAQNHRGADMPWITYEAEAMKTNGTVLGPKYTPHRIETESSRQQCVKLHEKEHYVEFTAQSAANAIVVRYSLPDAVEGGGVTSLLTLYQNGKRIQQLPVTSKYSWLYGNYPFTNDPLDGKPRNFYDEIRLKGLAIKKGDVLRLKKEDINTTDYCIIDLIDLENIAPPLDAPENSLSITNPRYSGGDIESANYTSALRKCIDDAVKEKKSVWVPPGTFKISGDIEVPSHITIQGAGMWHTILVGDESQYTNSDNKVRIIGSGSDIHLSDFSIIGKLNYRNDRESNDGIVGSFGANSTISRLWIEHTKVGVWVNNCSNLVVDGCRFRNTIADGANLCVGLRSSTIQNCSARGTGDDCFAIWPATHAVQEYSPGHNIIRRCTGQLPFLANGAAIYGGESNHVQDCLFSDISPGSAILISTSFPTASERRNVDNNFSGTTVVLNCDIIRSGGFDHVWEWRAAVQLCLDRRSISGVAIRNLNIKDSFSDGLSIIAPCSENGQGTLYNASISNVDISNYGIGVNSRHGLWIRNDAQGSLTISNSQIPESTNESADFTIHWK